MKKKPDEEEQPILVEIGVEDSTSMIILIVKDLSSGGDEVSFALPPETAYSMAVGIISALKTLPVTAFPMKGNDTLH